MFKEQAISKDVDKHEQNSVQEREIDEGCKINC